eukprot:6484401-Amphidinium_carterae.2
MGTAFAPSAWAVAIALSPATPQLRHSTEAPPRLIELPQHNTPHELKAETTDMASSSPLLPALNLHHSLRLSGLGLVSLAISSGRWTLLFVWVARVACAEPAPITNTRAGGTVPLACARHDATSQHVPRCSVQLLYLWLTVTEDRLKRGKRLKASNTALYPAMFAIELSASFGMGHHHRSKSQHVLCSWI